MTKVQKEMKMMDQEEKKPQTTKETIETMKVVEKEKVVEMNPKDEQTTGIGGTVIPTMSTPAPVSAASLKTENLADKAIADAANTGTNLSIPLQSIDKDATVNTTKKLHGGIDIGFTPVRKKSYFWWSETPLGDFTRPDELDDRIRERAIVDYPEWSKMPVALDVKLNPLHPGLPKYTDDNESGVPVLDWVMNKLNREERAENIGLITIASEGMDQELIENQADTYETHQYYNDQVNVDLLTAFSQDWEQDLRDPEELHAIYSQMNNSESTIVPLKPEYRDPRYNKIWHERTDESFNLIMDNSYRFRHMIIDMMASLIRSYVPMTAAGESTTADELFKVLRVKENVRDFTGNIPRNLSSSKATDFYASFFNACLMSRWGGIYIEIDFDVLDSTVILECILLKLMVPYSAMHHETAVAVDNYIARYVIPKLPGFNRGNFNVPEIRLCRRGDVNYLTQALGIQGLVKDFDVVREFLLTTGNGGGWNTTEVCDRVGFMNGTEDYINQRDIQYVPVGGIDNEDERDLDFPQFTRFASFIDVLIASPFNTDVNTRALGDAIKTLDLVVRRSSRCQGFAYYSNRVLKRLGLVACTYPSPVDLNNPANAKPLLNYEERINVQPGSIMSAIFLVDYEKTSEALIGKDFLKMGWCVNHWFANLTETTQLVVEMLNFRKWKRSDKVKKIEEMMTANFTMAPALHQMIGAYPAIYDMIEHDIPTRAVHDMSDRRMTRGIRRLEDHIKNNLIRYGVVDHFFYDPRPGVRQVVDIPQFAKHFQEVISHDDVGEVIDWDRLVDLHSTSTYQPLVERMQNEGKLIRYNIPIKLKPVEMPRIALVGISDWNPIDYLPGNKFIGIKDLPIYYFWKEKFDMENDNYLAHSEKPRWISDAMYPFVWRGRELDFDDFVGHRFNFRKEGFQIWDKFEFGNLY